MIFSYEEYERLKNEMKKSSYYDAGSITMLKSAYKCGYGFALYTYCKRFNRRAILNDQIRQDWVQIAHNSTVFAESEHSVDCIMQELHPRRDIKLVGFVEHSFKKVPKTWQKDALRESETIKEAYKKVAKHDNDHFNPQHEQKKIKKALKFIYFGITTYYTSGLPTYLTVDEYSALSIANANNAKDRYRYVKELNCYSRIGNKRFKPAVILFGDFGARILFKKKIERFDKLYRGFFGN